MLAGKLFIQADHLPSEPNDIWMIQGDTTSAMVIATVAFHKKLRIAHVFNSFGYFVLLDSSRYLAESMTVFPVTNIRVLSMPSFSFGLSLGLNIFSDSICPECLLALMMHLKECQPFTVGIPHEFYRMSLLFLFSLLSIRNDLTYKTIYTCLRN
jgi:hypothetical protein